MATKASHGRLCCVRMSPGAYSTSSDDAQHGPKASAGTGDSQVANTVHGSHSRAVRPCSLAMVDMPVPMKHRTIIEPCRIKSVKPIGISTAAERREQLAHAHYNPFLLRSKDVIIDLMTDGGTSAMSAQQWVGMMERDEAYAGSRSWERMELAVQELTTMANVLPTHQGRAAERIIYGHLGGPGKVFISNTHFDTTRANIEFTGAMAIDIPIPEGRGNGALNGTQGMDRCHMPLNVKRSMLPLTNPFLSPSLEIIRSPFGRNAIPSGL